MAVREIRRKNRAQTEAEAREILARAEHGVLATVGEDGWPYAVPLNQVVICDALYAHCALEGHKLQNIAHEERVSYCAIASARVVPATLSTLYESAIVFGRAALVRDADEKRCVLKLLTERFCGRGEEQDKRFEEHMRKNRDGQDTAIVRIAIERITGKAHRENPE
jgi:nitroimidazol reductase NimA-like FMN-containing flavoprotein (pyridoxamine 5'-phosphate oxidase superfamily)